MTSFLRRGASGRSRPFCGICTKWHIFCRQTLCKMTNRNFLKTLDKFRLMWYNIIVVKGRKVNGREKPTTATRKKF